MLSYRCLFLHSQADTGAVPRYRGFVHALTDIVKTEGALGLYKGVGPNCGRATVLAAAELSTYDVYVHREFRLVGFLCTFPTVFSVSLPVCC